MYTSTTNRTKQFDVDLATLIGVGPAIVLNSFAAWEEYNMKSQSTKHYAYGRWWTAGGYNWYIKHDFPFMCRNSLRNHLDKLRELGLLYVVNAKSDMGNEDNWYSVRRSNVSLMLSLFNECGQDKKATFAEWAPYQEALNTEIQECQVIPYTDKRSTYWALDESCDVDIDECTYAKNLHTPLPNFGTEGMPKNGTRTSSNIQAQLQELIRAEQTLFDKHEQERSDERVPASPDQPSALVDHTQEDMASFVAGEGASKQIVGTSSDKKPPASREEYEKQRGYDELVKRAAEEAKNKPVETDMHTLSKTERVKCNDPSSLRNFIVEAVMRDQWHKTQKSITRKQYDALNESYTPNGTTLKIPSPLQFWRDSRAKEPYKRFIRELVPQIIDDKKMPRTFNSILKVLKFYYNLYSVFESAGVGDVMPNPNDTQVERQTEEAQYTHNPDFTYETPELVEFTYEQVLKMIADGRLPDDIDLSGYPEHRQRMEENDE